MRERALIARLLAPVATHPAARGLADDAAVLVPPMGRDLVFTHDMLAEGVHFLGDDPPADVAGKLVAVNLSDLAAMGARPLGVLMGLGLAGQGEDWLAAFVRGLGEACARWSAPLLGGDTVAGLGALVLGMTAIGQVAPGTALSRGRARAGDDLWVSGNIGDAGLGLAVLRGRYGDAADDVRARLIAAYRRPEPRLALGAALVGLATACMDVSDGLLIDAERFAAASGVRAVVRLGDMPVSRAAEAVGAAVGAQRLALAAAGDDYELLFAAAPESAGEVVARAKRVGVRVTRVGEVRGGAGLEVIGEDGATVTPERLGWEH